MDEELLRLGMPVPDSKLAGRARELIRGAAPAFLVNHSVRVFGWALELARHDELRFDPEILYVSAMLHDIGLVPAYDLGGCYEVDGAIAAARFMREAGNLSHGPRRSTTPSPCTTTTSWPLMPPPRSCSSGTRPGST